MITREQALEYLRRGIGNPAADFREGHWEAIDGALHKGWGMGPSVESAGNADACALCTGQVAPRTGQGGWLL